MSNLNQADRQNLRYLAYHTMPKSTFALLDTFYQIVMILLGWWSLPLELLIRKEFGERYLSLLRIWIAWMLLGAFTFFYALYATFAGNPMAFFAYSGMTHSLFNTGVEGLTFHLFYYAFLSGVVFHRYRIWKRTKDGVVWLSTSFGISHLSALPWHLLRRIPTIGQWITVDDYFLYRFVEPALCFVLGRLLYRLDGLTGSFVVISAVALFIKNNLAYAEARGRVLDMIDAGIESQYLADALAGRPKETLAGFSVVPVPVSGLFDEAEPDYAATVQESLAVPGTQPRR